MKVLWITNVAPSVATDLLGTAVGPFGGWLDGSLETLRSIADLDIDIAFPHTQGRRSLGSARGITCMSFPPMARKASDREGLATARAVIRTSAPDVVHIHGTELHHSLSFATAAAELGVPTVVSLQGLVSAIALHARAHLPLRVVHGPGRRPWVRSARISGQQRAFELQGELERRCLRSVGHVIGRTTWDRACSMAINASLQYHHCDETLRPSFYGAAASRTYEVQPRSIVVGQSHYAVKGFHLLLAALPSVVARYPSVQVTVAGHSPVAPGGTPYGRHLARLLSRSGMEDRVRFTGPLNEAAMLGLYQRSAVVVSPSVIENSPNSVAEGMLLGMPVVASYVGGVPDMITSGVDGLTYQADAPYMLAHALNSLFADDEFSAELGKNAQRRARLRHDPTANAARTMSIYNQVIGERVGH